MVTDLTKKCEFLTFQKHWSTWRVGQMWYLCWVCKFLIALYKTWKSFFLFLRWWENVTFAVQSLSCSRFTSFVAASNRFLLHNTFFVLFMLRTLQKYMLRVINHFYQNVFSSFSSANHSNRSIQPTGECTVLIDESNHGTLIKNFQIYLYLFDLKSLDNVINVLIFSRLFFCSPVSSITSEKNVSKLQSVQNFATRIVTGSRKHITPGLTDLNWLSVSSILTSTVALSRLYV